MYNFNKSLDELLADRALAKRKYNLAGKPRNSQLRKWMAVLEFGDTEIPGIELCVDEPSVAKTLEELI